MDSNEFKILVLPLGQKLHRFAAGMMKDIHEGEDIVQDIFVKLWNMREQIGEIKNIDAFTFRMTRNLCLDRLKARKPKFIDEHTEQGLNNRKANSPDPENQMIMNDTIKEVNKLIGQLPEQQKTIIHMRDVEGYSYEEIAEVMNMEVNAIRVNISRARKSVRESMSKIYQPWKI